VPGNVFDSTMVVTGAQVEVVGGGDDARLEHSYGCEKARVALSSDWTSSLLPTKSPKHLDAVGDNLGLPAEPATATLCARPRQDLHRKPVSRSGIWRRESRAFAVWCAKAGSVRPANHRPGRLPEGRTEGPSLEPGCRSTVRRTADPSVSFAERGAVSEGIQIQYQRFLDAVRTALCWLRKILGGPRWPPQAKCITARRCQLSRSDKEWIHPWGAAQVNSQQNHPVADRLLARRSVGLCCRLRPPPALLCIVREVRRQSGREGAGIAQNMSARVPGRALRSISG